MLVEGMHHSERTAQVSVTLMRRGALETVKEKIA